LRQPQQACRRENPVVGRIGVALLRIQQIGDRDVLKSHAGIGTVLRHPGAQKAESRMASQRFENVERILQMVQRAQEHGQSVFTVELEAAI